MSRILAVTCALLVSTPALAQDAEAAEIESTRPSGFAQTVTPDKVRLAEPFVRQLVITHPKDQRYELVPPRDPGEFEILEQTRSRKDGDADATTTFRLKMSAFELGERTLPPVEFAVTGADGVTRRYLSPEAKVQIDATLPPEAAEEGAQLYDIRPPEAVPVPSYALIWAALAAMATALAVYLFVRWLRRPKPERVAPPKPVLPLHVRTRNALDQLGAEKLPERGEIKAFYSRLSEIVRGYLGERYGVEALEATTTELLDSLQRVEAPTLPREGLAAFLQESDLVKFAKAQMSVDSCNAALQFGYRLVEDPPDAAQRHVS